MEFISNSSGINHKDTFIKYLTWAKECYFCTSFFDKKGLDIIFPSIKNAISDRDLKITIFSNGEKEYTKPSVITRLKKTSVEHNVIIQKDLRLHSKIYLFIKNDDFVLIIGSANLTGNGLVNNEEFSTMIKDSISSIAFIEIKKYFEHLASLKSA